jgi:hypothetical protein
MRVSRGMKSGPSQCPAPSPPPSGHLVTDGRKARENVQGASEPHGQTGLGEDGKDERKLTADEAPLSMGRLHNTVATRR